MPGAAKRRLCRGATRTGSGEPDGDVGRVEAPARLLAASALGDRPSESDGETDGAASCRGGGDSEREPGAGAAEGVLEAGRAAGVVRGADGADAALGAAAAGGAAGAAARGLTRRLRKGRSVRTADERLTAID
ncbi:hypothetical protein N2K95_03565 [Arthrobacter zhaoxinii]|uniref:Uncharacterized protein n=1 Tax=Arthrobacter zhaoxinii TaxID=2964616 RepID=A0ABY5YUV4_9MICC|nr:hypothetical protein [Arthrobacter zhaoxinii]UWX97774.1 hypothetical protein N2K95_03565 [Arthrobacter zhaoxinii]